MQVSGDAAGEDPAGSISCTVSERKKELGIRMALGAGPGRLMRMVLRQTIAIASVGRD
jgi:ABC-type antimicrobial peptide transport system permease subunit